jgi:hypothetical protein
MFHVTSGGHANITILHFVHKVYLCASYDPQLQRLLLY